MHHNSLVCKEGGDFTWWQFLRKRTVSMNWWHNMATKISNLDSDNSVVSICHKN